MCLSIPAEIIYISEEYDELNRMARIRFGTVNKEVSLAYVPQAKVGDYVLVHVGFALSVIDEKEAKFLIETLDLLN